MLIWGNVNNLLSPILNFLSNFTEYFIGPITNFLSWIMGALEWIIDGISVIFSFFGFNTR